MAQKAPTDLGKKIYTWETCDYHPHRRGIIWYAVFASIIFGTVGFLFFKYDEWISPLSILVIAILYFFIHRNEVETHTVVLYKEGILIGEKSFFLWEEFLGFWFLYDEKASVLNLVLRPTKNMPRREIKLQMGEETPKTLVKPLEKSGIKELTNYQENLIDLWIRILKL